MSRAGAIAGMFAGGLTVLVWAPLEGGVFDIHGILPGAISAAIAAWIFSLVAPDDRATEQYQRMLD